MKKIIVTLSFTLLFLFALAIGVSAETIFVEAEDLEIAGGFEKMVSDEASGGAYLQAKNSNYYYAKKISELIPDYAHTTFTVNESGTFTIWLRVACYVSYDRGSLYFNHDNVLHAAYFTQESTDFRWIKLSVTKFEAGEHDLKIYTRASGSKIDKIIFTSDPFYTPDGLGEPPEHDTVLYNNGEGDLRAPLPAIVPPNEHPRLLVRSSDLPRIRENLNHPQNKAAYERVLEKAQSKNKGDQASYSADLLEYMQSKAFLYLVNGDEEMGRQAVEMVMNHMEKSTYSSGATFASDTTMRFAGHIIFATACVYDWCYDLFTPEQREEYISRANDMITMNFEGGYPHVETKGVFTGGHNVENPWYKDALAYAIAIYDEDPFAYNNMVGFLNMNYFPFLNWYYPSEWMPQSTSTYGDFRYSFEIFCDFMLRKLGQKPFVGEGAHFSAYKSIYLRRPDGAFIVDNDEATKVYDNTYRKTAHGNYFILGNLYRDPYLKWQYYKNKASTDYFNTGITGVNAAEYLVMNDTTVDLDNTLSLPLTKYYPSPIGNMVARTSWEEGADSPAVICLMKPSENFMTGHAHVEPGNFVLYYKGMLAMDSGQYEAPSFVNDKGETNPGSSWGKPHYMSYFRQPVAHNVLLVYDPNNPSEIKYGGQKFADYSLGNYSSIDVPMNGERQLAKNIAYDYGPDSNTPEYSYLETDLSYGMRTDRVEAYTRSFMFLNLFDDEIPAALIVYDRVKSTAASYEKSWLLHSQEEPKVEGNVITIDRTEWHNSGRLTDTVLMPEKNVIDKVGGPGMEYWNGVTNEEIYRQPVGDESGTWRIELKPAEKNKQDYFLNVIQVSDPDDSIAHHEVTYNEQGEFVGIFVADRAVFMKKEAGQVYKDFEVTADGDGEISYIITDLAEGKWIVTDEEGNEVYSEAISGEHGVLRFRTAPGTYKVHWEYQPGIEPKTFGILTDAVDLGYTPVDIFVNDKNYNGRGRLEDGTVFISLNDFEELTNRVTYTVDGDKFSVKGGTGTMEGEVGNTEVTINGEPQTLSMAPAEFDGKIYLPLDECLRDVFEFVSEYDDLTYVLYLRGGYYMVPGAELEIVNSEERNRADIIAATCSGVDAIGNEATKSLDDNYNSYWCVAGKGGWITYELAETYELTGVGTAWSSGSVRQEHFAIHVSEDGEHWTEMWRGDSSGKTARIEDFMFNEPIKAKYVKLECNGNTSNQMNSLLETHIYCTEKTPYYEK